MEAISEDRSDLESVFTAHYRRGARTIALTIGDRARAEELAVEVFLRWSQSQSAKGLRPEGWLYRAAANIAVDELRRRARGRKFDQLFGRIPRPSTPEEIHC